MHILSCFGFGVILNEAVMHIYLQVFVWMNVLFLLGKYQGVELLGCMKKLPILQSGCAVLCVHH